MCYLIHLFISFKVCNNIWSHIFNLFSPWIIPYNTQQMANWMQHLVDGTRLLPWSSNYMDEAEKFVNLFVETILYAMELFNESEYFVGYLFSFYDAYFVDINMPKYILEPIHRQFSKLDWSVSGWMVASHITSFHRIIQQYLPECHSFIGSIFLQIEWSTWLEKNIKTWDINMKSRMMQSFLYIFLKLSHEPCVQQVIFSVIINFFFIKLIYFFLTRIKNLFY